MTQHLFAIIATPHGTAANNRGETDGNTTTLQKLLWNGQVHTTVSAEAIRWAIRYSWQERGETLNRTWNDAGRQHIWAEPGFSSAGESFVDDDVLGFMSAEAAKVEVNPEPATPGTRTRQRGTATIRRARLEVTRAVSLLPWAGDISFNAASVGATPSASKTGKDPVPYSAEIHATRYQYGMALTPSELVRPERALLALEALAELHQVAGNHGRFLYDFAPDAVALRWTADFAPRMLYAFGLEPDGSLKAPDLLRRVRSGDVSAPELVVGGSLADTPTGTELAQLGATVVPGVKAAFAEIRRRMVADLGLPA